jgi:hypothetical protein
MSGVGYADGKGDHPIKSVLLRMGKDHVEKPASGIPQIYDIRTDEMRDVTQFDLDELCDTARKYSPLLRSSDFNRTAQPVGNKAP